MNEFSHVDSEGRASMVDVSSKKPQRRIARARCVIALAQKTIALIKDNEIKKGDVLTVAEIAGVQAAKRTPDLIPLCHPLQLSNIQVQATLNDNGVTIESRVICVDRTGVEMEALTAVSIALLTVYDMCKAVDRDMAISDVVLLEKRKEQQ